MIDELSTAKEIEVAVTKVLNRCTYFSKLRAPQQKETGVFLIRRRIGPPGTDPKTIDQYEYWINFMNEEEQTEMRCVGISAKEPLGDAGWRSMSALLQGLWIDHDSIFSEHVQEDQLVFGIH